MIKMKLKVAIAAMLTVTMMPTAVPVKAQTVNAAIKSTKQYAEKKHNVQENKTYAEGEAIILYQKNASVAKSIRSTSSIGKDMEIKETYEFDVPDVKSRSQSKGIDNYGLLVSLVKSDKYSTEELVAILKKRKDIKYAEPNYRIQTTDMKDPYKQYQWALENQGQNGGTEGFDIQADTEALTKSVNDEEKVIALIDTGIDYTHEDLKNVVWNNPVNSKQLKGEHGYDFINYDDDPMDDNGHGTHCSGIMAATSNNEVGIAGTADSEHIKIMGLKILDEEGYGYGMEAIGAYNYIYKAQQMGVNVVAVNNSWYGEGETPEIFLEIINLVGEAGALSVCAAGNESENNDFVDIIPANMDSPYIISVAASNENDELAAFSNYGSNVDIAAPGTDILSTVSYDTFNPVLYDNKDELCSFYQDFEIGNLIPNIEDGTMTDAVAEENDIGYGFDADGKANMEVDIDEDTYFGTGMDGTKSLRWTIENAEEGGVYTLYLPYVAEKSWTALYSSLMVKVSGPSGSYDEFEEVNPSVLYVSDGTMDKEGNYDKDSEKNITGMYIDEGNYWNLCTGQVAEKVEDEQQRAMTIQVVAGADGDYTINVDNMGVSKADVAKEAFGKYDFYNGTSMAAPYVTGAVAAIANAFEEQTALERKARILGSIRKSDSMEDMVNTGGVLDLSSVEAPGMYLESVKRNEENQIEIYGYYLAETTVKVNEKNVIPIEQNNNVIVIDGKDYLNQQIDITLTRDGESIETQHFFMSGKAFDEAGIIEGGLNGGAVVSGGQNLYYVNDEGNVFVGEPKEDTLDWRDSEQQYLPELFGEFYKTSVDYTIVNNSNFICLDKKIYTILSIDVGYSEDVILACFDEAQGWKKYADLPEEFADLEGITLAAYQGEIYIIGGFHPEKGTFSKQVKVFDEVNDTWTQVSALPEARCFSEALQVGNKLVITLGGNGKNSTAKNIIFDGKEWTLSKTSMGKVVEPETYYYEKNDDIRSFQITSAQIGLVQDGIVYTDLKIEGVGDTFIYNLSSDEYTATGYCLDRDSLDGDQVVATTVQNKLYVLYGWSQSDEWDWEFSNKNSLDFEDLLLGILGFDTEDESMSVCTMPIQSGYVRVIDNSSAEAYVQGTGYYLPGDTVRLVAWAKEGDVKSFTVNGKIVNADRNGEYIYEEKAQGTVYEMKALAEVVVKASIIIIIIIIIIITMQWIT